GPTPRLIGAFSLLVPGHELAQDHASADGFAPGFLALQRQLAPAEPLLGQCPGAEGLGLRVDDLAVALEPDLGGVSCRAVGPPARGDGSHECYTRWPVAPSVAPGIGE